MSKLIVFMLMLMLAASPLSAAPGDFKQDQDKDKKEKKDKKDKVEKDVGDKAGEGDDRRPAGREIRREAEQVTFEKSRTIQKKYGKGDDVIRFTPVNVNGLKMSDFVRGTVVGLLDIDRKGEGTGLPPGKYHVYVKRIKGDWA